MARPLRLQYPGAVYHVLARDNHGMDHYTRVTQAISRLNRHPGKNLEKLERKLSALAADHHPACYETSLFQDEPLYSIDKLH